MQTAMQGAMQTAQTKPKQPRNEANAGEVGKPKKLRRHEAEQQAPSHAPMASPAATSGGVPPVPTPLQRKRAAEDIPSTPSSKFAWALSSIRSDLHAVADVEGVSHVLAQLPNCVLVGSIAARRELVGALLGKHQHAGAAAAALVAPGVQQPVMVEIRSGNNAQESDSEADAWLQSVITVMQRAMGNRLRATPQRIRLSAPGGADVDLLELPDRPLGGNVPRKLDEIRGAHLGAGANLLICLEKGEAFDECRRFDPQLKRTVLLGAASPEAGDRATAEQLCGPQAAKKLQEHFTQICSQRLPRLQENLGLLEIKLHGAQREAQGVLANEAVEGLLARARAVGLSFGRALQQVIGGTPGCIAGSLVLEAELVEFAATAEKGSAGLGKALTASKAQDAAQSMWMGFEGGVRGYAQYLEKDVRATGADVSLNGGAAWQRLLVEIEVAMRLAHPSEKDLSMLAASAVQAGGTSIHGHQRWDDVASKLLMSIAFKPLYQRIQYIAARVSWILRQQKAAVSDWLAMLADGPGLNMQSPLFAQHLEIMRSSPLTRDLVFQAYDRACEAAAARLLQILESTLTAACLNASSVMRPNTKPSVTNDASAMQPAPPPAEAGAPGKTRLPKRNASSAPNRGNEARKRVIDELQRRTCGSGGLLPNMRDRTFQPKEAKKAMAAVEQELKRAFSKLSNILANQAVAFADTTLTTLCRRYMDEEMSCIRLDENQERAVGVRHAELKRQCAVIDGQVATIGRCISECQSAKQQASLSSSRQKLF